MLPKNHRVDRAGGGGESARASSESRSKTPDARGRSWAMRLVPSAADPAKKTSASGAASATPAAPPGRHDAAVLGFSSVLGVKRAGTWFGHTELLQVHEEVKARHGHELRHPVALPTRRAYGLLLLVKDDVFVLLEEYPYLRDLLAIEPEVRRPEAPRTPCVDSVSAAVSSSGVGVESIAEEDDRGEGTGAAGSRTPLTVAGSRVTPRGEALGRARLCPSLSPSMAARPHHRTMRRWFGSWTQKAGSPHDRPCDHPPATWPKTKSASRRAAQKRDLAARRCARRARSEEQQRDPSSATPSPLPSTVADMLWEARRASRPTCSCRLGARGRCRRLRTPAAGRSYAKASRQ